MYNEYVLEAISRQIVQDRQQEARQAQTASKLAEFIRRSLNKLGR